MGGSIKVTVRFSEDHIESQMRWTNSLPYHFRTPKLITEPVQHWRDYLDKPSEYREDGENVVVPDGYGLVVIDLVTMTIAHSNGYSGFTSRSAFMDMFDDEDREDLRWFIDNKLANLKLIDIDRRQNSRTTNIVPITNMDEIEPLTRARRRLEDVDPNFGRWDSIEYNITPWTMKRFDEDMRGGLELKAWLVENGFKLDEGVWRKWEASEREAHTR